MTNLDRMIHDLANRIHVTGLALQMLTVRRDSAVPAEVYEQLQTLEADLHAALTAVQEMQSLMRKPDTHSSASSPPRSAA